DRTQVVCEWLFHPDAVSREGFDPRPAVDFWDMTNTQDWHVSELSQQGIASRVYSPGLLSRLESMVAAWDGYYLRALGE
ncbi:MAG: SRPBCC family protein, partial [Acidobacteriota bacterium]